MKSDPITLELFKNRFSSIAQEMGVTLQRTSFSPNIKERLDFSCAVFDKNAEMVAQAAHIPVHLGSMPLSVKSAVKTVEADSGDMIIVNDPYKGGTHLPDITIVAPIFLGKDSPQFYVANRAHHSDVGGISPGSMPLSTSLYQEGIIIPPMKIIEHGIIDKKLMKFFLHNVRTPFEREGDLTSQIMANLTGIKRIKEIVKKYSFDTTLFYANSLNDYSESIMRKTIMKIPNGIYRYEDLMDNDGQSTTDVKIKLTMKIKDDTVELDFSESDDQTEGNINAVYAITMSAALYVFRSLIAQNIPTNSGCMRPIKVITRKASVVDAEFPSAVAAGNVETSQRIVDVILGALFSAIPEAIPAASQGTMNNITIGGTDELGKPFTYYETIGGGMGAGSRNNGESAIHSHMTNTLNTPIEALEYSYPFIVTEYSIRKESGGEGKFYGGNGLNREIKLLSDVQVTVLSERRKNAPYGLKGGDAGQKGKNIVKFKGEDFKDMPSKFSIKLKKDDIIRIETPGGGGYGKKTYEELK